MKDFEDLVNIQHKMDRAQSNVVNLWVQGDNWWGLIVPSVSGVVFSNQTDGAACRHPELPGVYIPLSPDIYVDLPKPKKIPLGNGKHWTMKIERRHVVDYGGEARGTVLNIKQLVKDSKLPLKFIKKSASEEAWMWVKITGAGDNYTNLKPFVGKEAVLVYPNSD